MTLQQYLQHRRRNESIVIGIILLLIGTTNATTIILERYLDGLAPNWLGAFATEYSAIVALPPVLLLLFYFLNSLDLNLQNIRWRILWLIPGFFAFSLLHIGLFTLFRKMLWPMAGYQYEFGPILLSLTYEMRKSFWAYLIVLAIKYSYQFILDRLRGEAKFLSQADDTVPQTGYRDQFLVKMLDREFLVRVDEIEWVQSASNYALLHCGSRHYPIRQTLKNLSEQLDPQHFLRVHRTAIVNLGKVASLKDKGGVGLTLQSGETLPVSKTYMSALRQALSGEPDYPQTAQ